MEKVSQKEVQTKEMKDSLIWEVGEIGGGGRGLNIDFLKTCYLQSQGNQFFRDQHSSDFCYTFLFPRQ